MTQRHKSIASMTITLSLAACTVEPYAPDGDMTFSEESMVAEPEIESFAQDGSDDPEESELEAEIGQSFAQEDSSEAEALANWGLFLLYAQKMWEWREKISKIFEPTLTMDDLFAMKNDVEILKFDVMQLRDEAELLHARIDALTAETRSRAVGDAYANIQTAWDVVNDEPGEAFDASTWALNAANTLNQDLYYWFPYLPWTSRFDPRMAAPTFVIAVNTWRAIREGGRLEMNNYNDGVLRRFADRLAGVVESTRANVSCSAVQDQVDYPCGGAGGTCETHECHNYIECWDGILSEWSYYDHTRRTGTCPYVSSPAPGHEVWLEQALYGADTHESTVQGWRAYADMPNRNLALGQPAFDIPSTWVPPERAVDGNTNGDWWGDSVTHTDNTSQPWWWVDLGSVQHIREIRLFNRTDCCSSRLSHYQVYVSADSTDGWNGSWPLVVDRSYQVIADGDGTPQVHPVDVWARWVAVTKTNLDYLSLAEVQVMAD